MPLDAPYRLGPFIVDASGGITPPIDRAANFAVKWRGCVVRAELHGDSERVGLTMRAVLGRVPSTASGGAEPREATLAVTEALKGGSKGIMAGLSPDHRVLLRTDRVIEQPVTARRLVSEVTRFVLEAAPYRDLVDASGAGTVKT